MGFRCRSFMLTAREAVVLLALTLTVSCGGEKTDSKVMPAANPDDRSYAGFRGRAAGLNVGGATVSLAAYEGRFVWVDFAAPWCGPCTPQAQAISALEKSLGREVVFLTILTSGHEPFTAATRGTAKMWAQRFRLDPDHVVAGGSDHNARRIPQHFFFSPSGHTLYRHTGLLYADQIRSIVMEHRASWTQARRIHKSGM